MATIEALERDRLALLKEVIGSETVDTAKVAKRDAIAKDLASFTAMDPLQEPTKVVRSLEDARRLERRGAPIRLDLHMNSISTLSADVCALSMLHELSLVANTLERLPPSLANCRKLQSLQLGANRLSALPDLSALDGLLHVGLSYNEVDDARLPALVSSLPRATLRSLDLSGNRLCDAAAAMGALQPLAALRSLALQANPLGLRAGYRPSLLALAGALQLSSFDGTVIEVGEAAAPAAAAAAPAPAAEQPSGEEAAAAEAEEEEAEAFATLKLTVGAVDGLKPPKKSEDDVDDAPKELVSVSIELLGQTVTTAKQPLTAARVEFGESFELRVPLTTEARDALLVHGATLRVYQGKEEAGDEAAAPPAEGDEAAEAAAPVGPPPLAELRCALPALVEGAPAALARCSATVAPPKKKGSRSKKKPFTIEVDVTGKFVEAAAAAPEGEEY